MSKKYVMFAIFILFLLLVAAGGYYVLSGKTFLADLVITKVDEALNEMGGYEFGIESLEGNPITGMEGTRISVIHEGVEIVSLDTLGFRIDLPSVLTSPKLSRIVLSDVRADVDTVMKHLPQTSSESSGPPPLNRLIVRDSLITTRYGKLAVDTLDVDLDDGRYDVDLVGSFMDFPLKLSARIDMLGGAIALKNARVEWNGTIAVLDGEVSPALDLKCNVERLDMDFLGEIVPAVKDAAVGGIYSAELEVRSKDVLSASGRVSSSGGQISLLPFDKMSVALDFRENTLTVSDINVDTLGANVRGDATVALVPDALPTIEVKLGVANLAVEKLSEIIPAMKDVEVSGVVESISCDIKGPIDALSGNMTLAGKNLQAYSFPVTGLAANAKLKKSSSIDLAFSAKSMGAAIKGGGSVVFAPSVKLALDVNVTDISLATFGDRVAALKDADVAGVGAVKLNISGPSDAIALKGDVSFPSISMKDEYTAKDVAAVFEYSPKGLSLAKASALFNGALITAAGDLSANLRGADTLSFKGSVANAKLEDFAIFAPALKEYDVKGAASANWSLTGTVESPEVDLELKMPRLSLMKLYNLNAISAKIAYSDSKVNLEKASARMGEASASAGGTITLPSDSAPLGYNIKGSFDNVHPEDFVKMGIISQDVSGDLVGDFRVWSDGGEQPAIRVYFKDSRVVYANAFDISNLRGSLTLKDGDVHLENLRTLVNTGEINVNGKVGNVLAKEFSLEKMPLDLSVSVKSADIGRISRLFMPLSKGYQGIVNGSATIKGTAAAPVYSAEARLHGVRAFGLFLPVIGIKDVTGDMNELKIPQVRAVVGRGLINASASLKLSDGMSAHIEASGKSVDIRSLTNSLDDDVRKGIAGTLNFDFKGDGWLDSFEGSGEIYIPEFCGMGLKMTNFRAPFWVSDGFALIEDSQADFYGGKLNVQMAKDLDLSNWGGRAEIKSTDFSPMMKDLMPDSEGTITGSMDFTLRIAGDSTRTSMQDASGSVEITNGQIMGFPGTEAVSSMIGGHPLRFASAMFSFSVDGKTLYLLPGSRVSAPSGDPAFKYIMVDGNVVVEEQKIDLSCIGNVNIRALNSFASGLQSLVSAAMEDTGDTDAMLHNFLGGALSGFSRNEFRDVSLRVLGTPENIGFTDVEVAAPVTFDATPEILNRTGSSQKEKDEETFKLKLQFPVGPGRGRGDNVGGQIGGQIFEQAVKGLFSF